MGRDYVYERLTDTDKCWYKDYCDNYGTGLCTHCKKFTQTDYLFQLSNLPKNMWRPIKIDESGLSPDVSETLNTIAQDCEFFVKKGFNLYLYGDTGVGKTSWAVKIMNNYFAAISEKNDFTSRGLYISVPSFLRDFKLYLNYQSPNWLELLNTLKTCDLVIWDDIFQTDTTKYESQIVYSYINDRQFAGKSNIFTSNLSPEQVSMTDARLHSRICEGSDCLEITGLDMRYRKTYTEFMNSEVTDDGSTTNS